MYPDVREGALGRREEFKTGAGRKTKRIMISLAKESYEEMSDCKKEGRAGNTYTRKQKAMSEEFLSFDELYLFHLSLRFETKKRQQEL